MNFRLKYRFRVGMVIFLIVLPVIEDNLTANRNFIFSKVLLFVAGVILAFNIFKSKSELKAPEKLSNNGHSWYQKMSIDSNVENLVVVESSLASFVIVGEFGFILLNAGISEINSSAGLELLIAITMIIVFILGGWFLYLMNWAIISGPIFHLIHPIQNSHEHISYATKYFVIGLILYIGLLILPPELYNIELGINTTFHGSLEGFLLSLIGSFASIPSLTLALVGFDDNPQNHSNML